MKKTSQKTLELVQLSLFGAIIVLMAVTPFLGYIPLGVTRATIIHIPVILGSILLGPKRGAILGALFGLTSLLTNTFTPTLTSFVFSPFISIGGTQGNPLSLVICFVPRILTGIFPFYIYKLLKKTHNKHYGSDIFALAVAGLTGSLTNTLLVMHFIYLFFGNSYATAKNVPIDALYGVILSVITANGIPEAIVASILTIGIGKILLKRQAK